MIREVGFRKADDFYVALGQGKISSKTVVNKVLQRLKQGEGVAEEEEGDSHRDGVLDGRDARDRRRTQDATDFGIEVEGVDDVMVGSPSVAARFRATASSATSHSAAGSPSTATTART